MLRKRVIIISVIVMLFLLNRQISEASEVDMYLLDEEARRFADQIIDQIIEPDMTDFEKELAIHDYIVSTASYDHELPHEHETYLAYGVLVLKKGVCAGYASAFEMLCEKAGLECYHLISTEMSHGWNMIKLEGAWYHVDTTWDDPTVNGKVAYTYFNLSDDEMAVNHDWLIENTARDGVEKRATKAFEQVEQPSVLLPRLGNYFYQIDSANDALQRISLDGTLTEKLVLFNDNGAPIGIFENKLYYLMQYYHQGESRYINHIKSIDLDTYNIEKLVEDVDVDNYSKGFIESGVLHYYIHQEMYTINLNDSVSLKEIIVGDMIIPVINSKKTTIKYKVFLGDEWPEIQGIAYDDNSFVAVTLPEESQGTVLITVTDRLGNSRTYQLVYEVTNTSDYIYYTFENLKDSKMLYDLSVIDQVTVDGVTRYQTVDFNFWGKNVENSLELVVAGDFSQLNDPYLYFRDDAKLYMPIDVSSINQKVNVSINHIQGDFDRDGSVTIDDFNLIKQYYGHVDGASPFFDYYDVVKDGVIDVRDLMVVYRAI